MTPTQKKRDNIKLEAFKIGFVEDKWGHLQKTINGSVYRLKLQKTSLRYELHAPHGWMIIRSDYYKNILITDRGLEIKGVVVK